MAIEIKNKIVGYELVSNAAPASEEKKIETKAPEKESAEIIQMHEKLERPEMLLEIGRAHV